MSEISRSAKTTLRIKHRHFALVSNLFLKNSLIDGCRTTKPSLKS